MSVSVEVVRYIADAVLPCDGTGRVFRPGIVDVAGDTIVHVGPTPRDAGRRTTDGPATLEGERRSIRLRGLLLPGLVNVHCHSAMTLFRGAGGDLPVDRWLRDVLWPWEARLTPEDVFWGMSLAASDLLARGVTT
ncbi:MAG: amidohydrolase family protein, partial [Acidimicrobiales bacterium]